MKSTIKKCTCFVATVLAALSGGFGMTVNKAAAEEALDGRYYDVPSISTYASAGDVETVTFARREETFIGTPNNVPYYYSHTLNNACGPIGGGIVVGYYDKYFQNLIPNYTNYYTATGKYRLQDSTYVPTMLQEMYTAMQTNVVAPGVSESECLDGLEAYVEGKGYSLSYTTVKSVNGSFNYTAYQNAISNGQPVLLFCDSVHLVLSASGETKDEFTTSQVSQDHIVVGFGYRILKYYDTNENNFRTDIYVKVASGWDPNNMGYIRINEDSWLDSAYAVDIY